MGHKLNNSEISKRLEILLPGQEWTFVGNASNEKEFTDGLIFEGIKPTFAEVQNVAISEPSIADKLASVGLSLDELKAALGGN